VNVGEATCKSILNKSGIEGVEYAINPYIGCTHGCVYCYARFMTRWYHPGEKWGTFVDIKKNAIECLNKDIKSKKPGKILLSSVTDPYQPVEKEKEITRNILKILKDHTFPVNILTKSDLVIRDLDIISNMFDVEVGLTITCYYDETRKIFEPRASPINARIEALQNFSDVGISTYAFLGPLLPYLSEERLDLLLNNLADKVGRVIVDRLNIKAGNWKTIKLALKDNYPNLLDLFQEACGVESKYYSMLGYILRRELDKRAIEYDMLF
jgi:DNA repair photolyase